MAKLSDEEAQQLAALRAKEEAPDEPEGDEQGDGDDGHVIVLRGTRADAFLQSLIGPAKPAKKAAARKPGKPATGDQGDGDQGDGDDDQGDGDDAPPPRVNRFFK
jgi:hypothetical protein